MNTEVIITNYQEVLTRKGYRARTVHGYGKQLRQYLRWCEAHHLNHETTSLDELYRYKRYQVDRGLDHKTVRTLLTSVKHYFVSIEREDNPALLVKHRKTEKTLPTRLYTSDMLDELYLSLVSRTMIQHRDKAMLGLVIYQGLKREEINNLEVVDINTERGQVYVKERPNTHARTLALNVKQMGQLLSYLYEYRPKLLEEAEKQTDRLFFSMGKGNRIDNVMHRMSKQIKQQYPSFRNLSQLKESRMRIWVKEYGIRKAQYLSGIRYASSMLRYQERDVASMKRKLAIIHPMERLG